jgi:hypothetical protein
MQFALRPPPLLLRHMPHQPPLRPRPRLPRNLLAGAKHTRGRRLLPLLALLLIPPFRPVHNHSSFLLPSFLLPPNLDNKKTHSTSRRWAWTSCLAKPNSVEELLRNGRTRPAHGHTNRRSGTPRPGAEKPVTGHVDVRSLHLKIALSPANRSRPAKTLSTEKASPASGDGGGKLFRNF